MKQFVKILFGLFTAIFFLFETSCNQDGKQNITSKAETETTQNKNEESVAVVMDSLKPNTLRNLTSSASNENTKNSFEYLYSKENLERKLTKEFDRIDPLEYYLHKNKKFTNGVEMKRTYEELKSLSKIYRNEYYSVGNIANKQNDELILLSLINKQYPISRIDSIQKKIEINRSAIYLKSSPKNYKMIEEDDKRTLLNYSVSLMEGIGKLKPIIDDKKLNQAEKNINLLLSDSSNCSYLEYYNKGLLKYKFSNFDESIALGKMAIKLRNDFYLAHLLIGDAYVSKGLYKEAYEYYNAALSIKDNTAIRERVANTALVLGNYSYSNFNFSKIETEYFGDDRINYVAGEAISLAFLGKNKESFTKTIFLKSIRKDWAVPYMIDGWNNLLLNKYDEALRLFSESDNGDKFGNKIYSKIGLAVTYYCLKDYETASNIFNSLYLNSDFERLKNNPSLLLMSAFSNLNSAFPDNNESLFYNSEQKFKTYAELFKKDNSYYIGMSMCRYGLNDFLQSEKYLDSVKTSITQTPQFLYLKGLSKLRNENFVQATSLFKASISLDENYTYSMNGLGASLNAQQNYDESIKVFNKGLALDSMNPYLLYNKAQAIFSISHKLSESGKTTIANDTIQFGVKLMNDVVSIDSRFQINLNIGNAFVGVKDSIKALSYYAKEPSLYTEVNKGYLYAYFDIHERAKYIWRDVEKKDSTIQLAKDNLKTIEYSSNKSSYRYYYSYYYKLHYDCGVKIPALMEHDFEPLVPIGYSNLEFSKFEKAPTK